MIRVPLQLLAVILFVGALVAWFVDPSRRVDWIPLLVVSVAVSVVGDHVRRLEKRLDKFEGVQR